MLLLNDRHLSPYPNPNKSFAQLDGMDHQLCIYTSPLFLKIGHPRHLSQQTWAFFLPSVPGSLPS